MPPQILHESEGLRIQVNEKNRFCVVRLHYTADPAKRSEQWIAEAKAGMKPGAFEQEFDIDYTSQFGEKVFPAISLKRERIVCQPPYPTFPEGQRFWAGLDYGKRNPSSFLVFTEYDRVIYCVEELYEPAPNIQVFADKMLASPYYEKVQAIFADPHIGNETSHNNGVACTILSHFITAGIKKMRLGDSTQKGAMAWQAAIHEHWDGDDPTFRIFNCCPNLIREFGQAVYTSQSDAQLRVSNYQEGIVDNDNHAMDACKYFMLARPSRQNTGKGAKVKLPNQAMRW